jgi:hypothetical protein
VLFTLNQALATGAPIALTLTGAGLGSVTSVVIVEGSTTFPPIAPISVSASEVVFSLPGLASAGTLSIKVATSPGVFSNQILVTVKNGPTMSADEGPLKVLTAVPFPNPNPTALSIRMAGPADSMRIQAFTPALNLALEFQTGGLQEGWNTLALPGAWRSLPDGLYYLRLQGGRGTAVSSPVILKAVLIK